MKPNLDSLDAEEFKLFSQVQAPDHKILPIVTRRLEKDLVQSRTKLALTYVAGSVLGYLFSLAICAQCSVGLSPFAWQMASIIHEMPEPWCPFICGSIFGVAPFLVTLLFFNRFQHRYLLHKMTWLVIALPVLVSLSFMLFANLHDFAWDMKWLITAVATPYLCEALASFVLRQNSWQEVPAT